MEHPFDLIVIGGGHAGIEAAHIAARMGACTLLITTNLDHIGQMSCNPSVGGIAKGNIVREIDALGGLMGRLIDAAGIHFRMLNTSKGAAVWGNRAQADKAVYRNLARSALERQDNLFLLQGMVKGFITAGERITGVKMDNGEKIGASAVVLAAGTFLDGLVHIGLDSFPAGRSGEPSAIGLVESLRSLGIRSGRLKTGTSPRIDGRTVDYAQLTAQPGDVEPWPFSFSTVKPVCNRVLCGVGKSSEKTHAIIRENLDRSPLYTGKITSTGPRYCPSIEDKVVRFGDRGGHTLFLEPEGCGHREMYLNGFATSLPFDVQAAMVRSVKGLEKAAIVRPGYGIEYTFFQPIQLFATLESRVVKNLYFAGQVNGTSGYEEAACQGLLAGINAVRRVRGEEELVLMRDEAYSGVLIEDLVTRGTEEPYRMFTSRAEFRLKLRQDNCDERLMPIAYRLGLIGRHVYDRRRRVWEERDNLRARLSGKTIFPEEWDEPDELRRPVKADSLLKRPAVFLDRLVRVSGIEFSADREQRLSVEADIKYGGFVARQEEEVGRVRRLEGVSIPPDFDYDLVPGLLGESRQKLKMVRPLTVGQASRVPGVTPADVSIIVLCLARQGSVSRETDTHQHTGAV